MAFKVENASLHLWNSLGLLPPQNLQFPLKGKDSFWNHTILVGNRLDVFIGDQSRIASYNY